MNKLAVYTIDHFSAVKGYKKKDLATVLNVSRSQISFYVKNGYFILHDETSGQCEIVKTVRRFTIQQLNATN